MAIKAVIFDLDGTLLDSLSDLADSVNHTLRIFGYPERTKDEVRRFVGNGAVKLLERALPHPVEEEEFKRFYKAYDAYYTAHQTCKTAPYPGICKMLETLRKRGIRTAVLSNKQDHAVRSLCKLYFPNLLDEATGPTEQRRTKPSPDGLLYLSDYLSVSMDEILYVGDSEADILTGTNANVSTLAVLWGFRDKETLLSVGAKNFAESAEDILQFVL